MAIAVFDPVDCRANILAAVATGDANIYLPYSGSKWLLSSPTTFTDSPITEDPESIQLNDGQTLHLADGVELESKPGTWAGIYQGMIGADQKSNVAVRLGVGAQIRMLSPATLGITPSEHRHCVKFKSCTSPIITGGVLDGRGGDGLYIGPHLQSGGVGRAACTGVTATGFRVANARRNGISILSVNGLTMTNVVVSGTIGTSPQALIDFEPNDVADQLTSIVIDDLTGIGNVAGILFALHLMTGSSTPPSVLIKNSRIFTGGAGYSGLRFAVASGGPPSGSIEIRDCLVRTCVEPGVRAEWLRTLALQCTMRRVAFENVATGGGTSPFDFAFSGASDHASGGMIFEDCTLHETSDRSCATITTPGNTNCARGNVDLRTTVSVPVASQSFASIPAFAVTRTAAAAALPVQRDDPRYRLFNE